MRLVDKGTSPYVHINDYSEAQEFLLQRLGYFCSYCEFPIKHVPHVEHIECKDRGGSKTDWSNLLLGCTHCNSSKKTKIGLGERDTCIWPDEHNTFLAFRYKEALPEVNEEYLATVGDNILQKAKRLYEVLDLGYYPGVEGREPKKDRRYIFRNETLGVARQSLDSWLSMKNTNYHEYAKGNIRQLALQHGFFSIWMTVFMDEPEIKVMLIETFPGTASKHFDPNGNVVG
jgi:hypothetical protein